MINKTIYLTSILIFLVISLSSCSKKDPIKPSVRATERWQAMIDHDWKKAYSYESPSYRKNYTVNDFRTSFGQAVTWKSIQHNTTKLINKNLADVNLTLFFNYSGGNVVMDIPSEIKERWQLVDDSWWHIKN